MFGNQKNYLDHMEGCSKYDDLLIQHVYFPHWPTAKLILASALQEIRIKLVSNKEPKTIKSIKGT